MPTSDQSSDPFPPVDTQHGGPSRDAIAVYLRQLRDGFLRLSDQLETHKDKTSRALEEIRINMAKVPTICPRADECEKLWNQVDTLRLDDAKKQGAYFGGRLVLGVVCSSLGAIFALFTTWLTWRHS